MDDVTQDNERLSGDELWFEEELLPPPASVAGLAQALKALDPHDLAAATGRDTPAALSKGQRDDLAERFAAGLRGAVRAQRPRARRVAVPADAGAMAGSAPLAQGDLYLVRLGLEFELDDTPDERYRRAHCRFASVWCRATVNGRAPARPRVLEIAPDHVFEGGPRLVRVEARPSLTWGDVEVSLGGASTDVQIGRVAPATVGYLGRDEQQPHWKVTEKERAIDGRYHFWLLLELTRDAAPADVWLELLGEADVRSPLNILGLIPRARARSEQQVMTLERMLAG